MPSCSSNRPRLNEERKSSSHAARTAQNTLTFPAGRQNEATGSGVNTGIYIMAVSKIK